MLLLPVQRACELADKVKQDERLPLHSSHALFVQMSMLVEEYVLMAVKAVDFAVASEAKLACCWVGALKSSPSPALQEVFLRRVCCEAELEVAVTQLQQWSQYADQNQVLYKMVLQRMVTPTGT